VSSPTLAGYDVYRENGTAGQYTRLTITPIPKAAPTVYRDSSVQPGHTYFYTVTSVNTTGAESGYAQAISVTIPPYTTPPLFDPVPWAVAGVTLGVILGPLYGMVGRRRPACRAGLFRGGGRKPPAAFRPAGLLGHLLRGAS